MNNASASFLYRDLMLHQKSDARWVALPAREWANPQGEKQYARFVEFRDRRTDDSFRATLLSALDRYLAEVRP